MTVEAADSNSLNPIEVSMSAGGLPEDPRFRRAAIVMLMELKDRGGRIQTNYLDRLIGKGGSALDRSALKRPLRGWPGPDTPPSEERKEALRKAGSVFDALLQNGRIVNSEGCFVYVPPPGWSDLKTPEAKKANFEAVVSRVSNKVAVTPEGRSRVAALYRMLGTAAMYRTIDFQDGKAILVPNEVAIEAAAIRITKATLISVTSRGVRCHRLEKDGIQSTFLDSETLRISIEPRRSVLDRALSRNLSKTRILPKGSNGSEGTQVIDRGRLNVFASLKGQKDAVGAFIGEQISGPAWSSLLATLKRRPRKGAIFRATLFSILDPEIRKACLRDPFSEYELYNWFCHRNETIRKRRLQASAAYPLLTRDLKILKSAVDQAEPLAPAIANHLDVPASSVRQLVGLSWQKFGQPHLVFEHGNLRESLRLTGLLVPEDRPSTRAQWLNIFGLAQSMMGRLQYPPSPIVAHGLRRLVSIEKFVKAHIWDALRELSRDVRRATSLSWNEDGWLPKVSTSDLFIRIIMGEHGSVKRLIAFADDWHRGVSRRSATIEALKRQSALTKEIPLLQWDPMTPNCFESNGAVMRWLCDEDQLAFEGQELRHCVGGYVEPCFEGYSHIGSIKDAEGNRSTAEFRFRGKRVECVQHHTHFNNPPTPACEGLVEEFLKAANARKGIVDIAGLAEAAKKRRDSHSEAYGDRAYYYDRHWVEYAPMTPEGAAELLRLYDDCLPSNARHSPERWKEILEADYHMIEARLIAAKAEHGEELRNAA